MKTIILIELIFYLGAMLFIGYYFARKKMTESEFILGGKKLPGWALAFSERATAESAWLILGATGFVYSSGLSSAWMLGLGALLGIVVSWLFIARKFREEADKYNALTIPDYLAEKYKDSASVIRWFGGVIIIFFFTLYVAAQFSGAGKTLHVTFGIPVTIGVFIAAIIVVAYSCAGGFMSVVWTDVIQSILMIATLVLLPLVALGKIGANDLSIATELSLRGGGVDSWFGAATGFGIGVMIFNNFAWFFGWLGGQPHLSARFMALKSDQEAKTARNVALIWAVIAYPGVFLIGLTGATLYKVDELGGVEMLLPHMVIDLLPAPIAGLLLAGAIAAMMSTADSQLLVAGSSLSEDIIHKGMKKKISEQKKVLLSRICILCVGIAGFIFAFTSKSLIFTIVSWAWAGIGCTFSAAVILAFFWKRCSSTGIAAALITGFVTTIVWINVPLLENFITHRASSFILAVISGITFSILFPKQVEEKIS